MRLFILVLTIALGQLLWPGQAAEADPKGKRIAHLTTSLQHPFTDRLAKSLTMRAKMLGMEVTTYSAPDDAAEQARQLDKAVAAKYDLIVLLAASDPAIPTLLKRAKEAQIPVVLLNPPPEPSVEELYLTAVVEDNRELGRITGLSMLKALGESGREGGKVAVITDSLDEASAVRRVAGFKGALATNPKVKIVAVEDAKGDVEATKRIAKQLFVKFAGEGGLDGVYGMADTQAVAIIEAAEAAGLKVGKGKGDVIVLGSNCFKSGIAMIRARKQYSTGTHIPMRTGWVSADTIADHFNGKPLAKKIDLPVMTIHRGNADMWSHACTF